MTDPAISSSATSYNVLNLLRGMTSLGHKVNVTVYIRSRVGSIATVTMYPTVSGIFPVCHIADCLCYINNINAYHLLLLNIHQYYSIY